MNLYIKVLVSVPFVIFSISIFADNSANNFFDQQYFSANFTQTSQKDNDQRESKGRLIVSRNGYFKLDYFEPFRETIASDSIDLYRYDPDLEQLEIHPLEDLIEESPISLLSLSRLDLNKIMNLEECFELKDKVSCEISFVNEDYFINNMHLVFKDKKLKELTYEDSFLQTVSFSFKNQSTELLSKQDFLFEVPEETDVISYKNN